MTIVVTHPSIVAEALDLCNELELADHRVLIDLSDELSKRASRHGCYGGRPAFRVRGALYSVCRRTQKLAYEPQTDRPILQAYAGNYVSHARVDRLLFIARSKQGTAFGEDALRLALEELSQVHHRQRNSPDPCAILYLRSSCLAE